MPKVMLVEDDNNLREIYEARLVAEGYVIVAAHDGEEALALAVKERPDLIIADVMMPKISGFDMLDILRSTPETKNTKVIMMTALGQAEDRARADKLGADRYLIKSQVTLEDVIKVAHEVLNDSGPVASAAPTDGTVPAASVPVVAAPPVVDTPTAVSTPTTGPAPTIADDTPVPVVTPPTEPSAPTVPDPAPTTNDDKVEVTATPDAPPTTQPEAKEIGADLTQTKAAETDGVEKQIQDFISNNPAINDTASTEPAKPASTSISIPVTSVDSPPAGAQTQDQLSNPSPAITSEPVPEPPSHKKLVLQPTENALAPSVDINALLEKENQKTTADQAVATAPTNSLMTPDSPTTDQPASSGTPNDIAL